MSSSTSSSDPAAGWRKFCQAFVVMAVSVTTGLVAAAYVMDPYDTGRSIFVDKAGVRPQGPRTAAPSRGRDPQFKAAVFGNSHAQLLAPERLHALTDIPFVQLTVPGTGPKEQLVLLDWFLRHHRGEVRALVLGLDGMWCTDDPLMPNREPFPFWLFSESSSEYLRGLVSWNAVDELPRRLGYLFSRNPSRARPDGYWDYAPEYQRLGYDRPELRARLTGMPAGAVAVGNVGPNFPAAERLAAVLRALPPAVAVVVLFPPVYAPALPREDTREARADRACKSALARAAAAHPGSVVLDWRVARPETMNPDMFLDVTHYGHPLARLVESDIGAAILGQRRTAAGVTKPQ